MEFKARYELIGLFALVVLAGIFGFIYWLNNAGGFGERTAYQVRFSVPVSGLSVGSKVFFNGIQVGDVKSVSIDPADPKGLVAGISILKATPMRADTKAGIDYQGLTGTAAILLTGGDAAAPALSSVDGGPPVLEADPSASRSLSQNAGRALARFDDLLARNSGRVDQILEGLQRMTGGKDKDKAGFYDLAPASGFTPIGEKPEWQLVVAEPTVPLALNTDKLLLRTEGGAFQGVDDAKWTDNLPNLIQTKLIQSFENAGYTEVVLRPGDALDPENKLLVDLRGFYVTKSDAPEAVFDFVAKLIDQDGKVRYSRAFQERVAAKSPAAEDAVVALKAVFAKTAAEVVTWAGEQLSGAAAEQ